VLNKNLTVTQLVKRYPIFYEYRRFLTVFKGTRHCSLPWPSRIQSTNVHPIFLRSILILSFHLCLDLPSGLFPSGFATKILYACYMDNFHHGMERPQVAHGENDFLIIWKLFAYIIKSVVAASLQWVFLQFVGLAGRGGGANNTPS